MRDSIRNILAKDEVATVVLEAEDSEVKENSVCSRSGTYHLILLSILPLTDIIRVSHLDELHVREID